MEDKYTLETRRLGELLLSLAQRKKLSIRSLEAKMGVGSSVFRKVLIGDRTLQMRHVLMIADALGIGWSELFTLAYGHRSRRESELVPGDLRPLRGGEKDAEIDDRLQRVALRAFSRAEAPRSEGSDD